MRRDRFRHVSEALGGFRKLSQPMTSLAQLQSAWEEAVGEQIAKNAKPVAERDGTVEILCNSSVWANELEFLAPQLIESLNVSLSDLKVKGLKIRHGIGPGPES